MAGGIFKDRPFHPNWKCIVFGVALMAGYWWLPHKNPFMLPVIFIVGYIAMAWYDFMYECKDKMYSGTNPVDFLGGSWGKPQRRKEVTSDLVDDQEAVYKSKMYAFHVLVVAPILGYVGWAGKNTNPHMFAVVGALAVMALLYHGGRIMYPRETTNCPEEAKTERETLVSVYLLHIIVIFPLLAYVAWKGKDSGERAFSALLAIALLTLVYHAFRFFYPRTVKQCELPGQTLSEKN